MARYRRARRSSRRTGRVGRRVSRTYSAGGLMSPLLTGAAYGVIRQPLDTMLISKVTPYLGGVFGSYAPNVAAIGTAYVAGKYIPNAMVKKVANGALLVEGFALGQKLGTGFNLGTSNTTNTQNVLG